MEWMLQVWDELDDVVSTARLYWVGVRRSAAVILAVLCVAALFQAAAAVGAPALLLCISAVSASAVPALSLTKLRSV